MPPMMARAMLPAPMKPIRMQTLLCRVALL
jgi:hypothetical protein